MANGPWLSLILISFTRKTSVLVCALALLCLSICADRVLPADVVELHNRNVLIPLRVQPDRQRQIDHLRLFISEDEGLTWYLERDYRPTETTLSFAASHDGCYWFAIQIIAKSGTAEPANVQELKPFQKVCIKPERSETERVTSAVGCITPQPEEINPRLVIAAFDVPKHGDLVVVPVTIGATTYKFGVDTGCSRTIFDISLRQHMGQPGNKLKGKSGGRTFEVETRYPPRAKLGELDLNFPCDVDVSLDFQHRLPVPLLDLAALRKVAGHDVRGIIGMDFLKGQVVRIDFEKGRLWLLKAVTDETAQHEKIAWDQNGLPTITVRIVDVATKPFLIDTGHGGGATVGQAERELFQSLIQNKMASDVEEGHTYDFLGNESDARSAKFKSIGVSGFNHNDLVFAAGDRSILGLGYWSRYVVTLDFPNSLIYLTPAPGYQVRLHRHSCSGVILVSADGSIVVETVKHGTAAARAGVMAGDIITTVAGKSMRGVSVFEAYAAIESAGNKIPVEIRRGPGRCDLTMVVGGDGRDGLGQRKDVPMKVNSRRW